MTIIYKTSYNVITGDFVMWEDTIMMHSVRKAVL